MGELKTDSGIVNLDNFRRQASGRARGGGNNAGNVVTLPVFAVDKSTTGGVPENPIVSEDKLTDEQAGILFDRYHKSLFGRGTDIIKNSWRYKLQKSIYSHDSGDQIFITNGADNWVLTISDSLADLKLVRDNQGNSNSYSVRFSRQGDKKGFQFVSDEVVRLEDGRTTSVLKSGHNKKSVVGVIQKMIREFMQMG